jgi:hypothetical protein
MPASLKIADLHEAYHGASAADCIAMANLGAICWSTFKDGLYDQWAQSMTAEEAAQAAAYRDEGRQEGRAAMLETMKARLAAAEEVSCRLAAAEGTVAQLRASVEAEAARRVSEALEGFRKDYELTKMKEMTALHQRIAAAEARDEMLVLVREGQAAMKEKLAALEEERAALQVQLLEATAAKTKSSHAIGKQGEMTVLDMLENTVLATFPYSSVKDMTTIGHAADFHLWVMAANGQKAKILVDSKKYKRAINSDEIAKLHADVDADDEAHCGLMVSLDSAICTAKQFQIARTPKQKPVLYLSFQDIPVEMQREALCWGIRVLVSLIGEQDDAVRAAMFSNIDAFVASVETSVKEIDGAIRLQMKAVEGLRDVRRGLVGRLTAYKSGAAVDAVPGDTIEVEEEGCSAIVKATGTRCCRRVVDGERCGNHRIRKAES